MTATATTESPRLEDLNPLSITRRVERVLSSLDEVRRVAAASYRHANGFMKIVLLDGEEKLRLHLWAAGSRFSENIHTHRWDLVSRILHGTMREQQYLVSDGNTHEIYASSPRKGDSVEVSTPFRSCQVEETNFRTFLSGDMYESRQGEWHRTVIDNPPEPVLTACITSAPQVACAYVAHPVGAKVASVVPSPAVSASELQEALLFIRGLL